MTKTKLNLVKPLIKAIEPLTEEMSQSLKQVMLAEGWDLNDAATTSVQHGPSHISEKTSVEKFQAKYQDSESAFLKEYGSQKESPRATVRKFMSNSSPWEKRVAKLFERKAFK